MKTDPPVRTDLRCARCKRRRFTRLPKTSTQRSRAELLANLERDPFCSAICCRAFHDVDLIEQPQKANADDREWAVGE